MSQQGMDEPIVVSRAMWENLMGNVANIGNLLREMQLNKPNNYVVGNNSFVRAGSISSVTSESTCVDKSVTPIEKDLVSLTEYQMGISKCEIENIAYRAKSTEHMERDLQDEAKFEELLETHFNGWFKLRSRFIFLNFHINVNFLIYLFWLKG